MNSNRQIYGLNYSAIRLYILCCFRMFRQGMHDLKVWPSVEGDGCEPTNTPGRTSSTLAEDQMGRLAKVSCAIESGKAKLRQQEENMPVDRYCA